MVAPINPEIVEIVFSPRWFFGIDNLLDLFSVITTLLISFYSFRLYKFSRKRSYLSFSISFFIITLAFLAKIVTNAILYSPAITQWIHDCCAITRSIMGQSNILFILGQLAFRFLFLLGFFSVYWVLSKSKERNKFPFIIYLLAAVTLGSAYSYMLFGLTGIVILTYIVHYYQLTYRKNRKTATLLTLSSFVLILLSQLVFIFLFVDLRLYVVSEIIQLAGYLLLLYNLFLLIKRD